MKSTVDLSTMTKKVWQAGTYSGSTATLLVPGTRFRNYRKLTLTENFEMSFKFSDYTCDPNKRMEILRLGNFNPDFTGFND